MTNNTAETNPPTQPSPEPAPPQDSGGMMSFDAAASLADAFTKLQNGDSVKELVSPSEPVEPPASEGGDSGEPKLTTEPPKGPESASEKPEVKVPTSGDLARLRGKKTEAPAASSEPTDSDEMPKEAASLRKWAVNMKKDWKAEKARREELEAKLAEFEKNQSSNAPEELDRLRQLNQEYERELQVARVEATKEFKDAIVTPMQNIRSAVSNIAGRYEIAENEILSAFSESDPKVRADKLSDLTAGMNDHDKFSLYELVGKFSKIQTTRDKVVNNAKLALEKIEQHRQEQAKAAQEDYLKRYKSTVDKVWSEAQGVIPILTPVEGDDEWNKQIESARDYVNQLQIEQLNEDGLARVAVRSAVAPLIYGQFVTLFNKYQEMEKTLEKYQKATPKAGGGTSSPSEPAENFDDFMDALKAKLKS